MYLNPKSMQNNSPKPIITAIKAMILHTFGVQVELGGISGLRRLWAGGARSPLIM